MLGKVYFMMGRYGDARQALLTAMDASQDTTIGLELFDYNTKLTEWATARFRLYVRTDRQLSK